MPEDGMRTVFLDFPFLSLSFKYTPLEFFFRSTKMSLFSTLYGWKEDISKLSGRLLLGLIFTYLIIVPNKS